MTTDQLRALLDYIDQRILDFTEREFTRFETSIHTDQLKINLAEAFGADSDLL